VRPIAVAKRYARALADVAGEKDPARLEKVSGELGLVAEALARTPRATRFFEDPSVPRADKDKAIEALGRRAGISDLVQRFLRLLIENRRVAALPHIARAFAAIKDERLGIVPAQTTTAVTLSAPETRRFKDALEALTGRSVRLTLSVDPALLGGARTRIGSRVYDGTLRRRLDLLRSRLANAR
jgi:F-type H+-transporting ATPase subunit delta